MNGMVNGVSLTIAISMALVGLCIHLVARVQSERRLFFVALDRELTAEDRARSRLVVLVNAGVTLIGVVGSFVTSSVLALVVITCVLPFIPITHLLVEIVRLRRREEHKPVPAKYSVPLDEPPGIWSYISPPLHIAQLALLGGGSALFMWLRSRLPDVAPMHWNMRGEVDAWGDPSALWVFAGLLVFDVLIVWFVAWSAAQERWALPPNDKERYVELQRKRRSLIVRLVEVLMLGVNLGMVVLWLGIANAMRPGHEGAVMTAIVAGVVIMSIGTILPLALFLGRMTAVQDQIREIAGTDALGTREAGWRYGGLIYYCPEDPALFVPKRVGMGQTINFARGGAWLFIGALVVVPLVITVVAIAGAQ